MEMGTDLSFVGLWRLRRMKGHHWTRSKVYSFLFDVIMAQQCPHRCDGAAIVANDELGRRRTNPLHPTSDRFLRVVTDIVATANY